MERPVSQPRAAGPAKSPGAVGARGFRLHLGGARRDRTAALVVANDALSQLSYGPEGIEGTHYTAAGAAGKRYGSSGASTGSSSAWRQPAMDSGHWPVSSSCSSFRREASTPSGRPRL